MSNDCASGTHPILGFDIEWTTMFEGRLVVGHQSNVADIAGSGN
jgi:hypothetical protein